MRKNGGGNELWKHEDMIFLLKNKLGLLQRHLVKSQIEVWRSMEILVEERNVRISSHKLSARGLSLEI